MDEPPYEREPGWLEWALVIALVVVVVIITLFVLLPQQAKIFQPGPDNLVALTACSPTTLRCVLLVYLLIPARPSGFS